MNLGKYESFAEKDGEIKIKLPRECKMIEGDSVLLFFSGNKNSNFRPFQKSLEKKGSLSFPGSWQAVNFSFTKHILWLFTLISLLQ